MDEITRRALIAALAEVNQRFSRALADPIAEVSMYAARFLRRHRIYRVDYAQRSQRVAFYVGFAPGGPAHLLTGRPAEFVRLARVDEVAIDEPEMAAEYAAAYLETTRSMSRVFYLARSVAELRFRPNLDGDGELARADVTARYRDAIEPPKAVEQGRDFTVVVYAVREQALERHRLTVDRDGGMSDEVTTLESGLPLVYGS